MTLNFKNGKATIKRGRKIIAKAFHLPVFFAKFPELYKHRETFSLEIKLGAGWVKRDCETLDEVEFFINKYC